MIFFFQKRLAFKIVLIFLTLSSVAGVLIALQYQKPERHQCKLFSRKLRIYIGIYVAYNMPILGFIQTGLHPYP